MDEDEDSFGGFEPTDSDSDTFSYSVGRRNTNATATTNENGTVASTEDVLKENKKVYDIDFVGNGSFHLSQLNILSKRSIEPVKTVDAMLSARNLHHRSRDVFVKEVKNTSNMIVGLMRGEKVRSAKYKPSASLFQPHFQRALALERLQKIDQAIDDYTICIRINDKSGICYFNRAGLYRLKKNFTLAMEDISKAVELEPANVEYRMSRALIGRESGNYSVAVEDTVITRALEKQPSLARTLENGGQVIIDSDQLYINKKREDPILVALSVPPKERTVEHLEPIKDFLKNVRIFSTFNSDILAQISSKVETKIYNKNEHIFDEGDPGHHFYMIVDGEVSIVKVKKVFEDITETTVLVKMYRGQTFGETALESKGGLRTAGAIASQLTRLLTLHADEYQSILSRFRTTIKEEVRLILSSSALFEDWEAAKIDYLASFVIIKSFSANTEILKANEPVPCLMMIKSGIVTLLKSIPKPANIAVRRTATGGIVINEDDNNEVPGLWILNKTWNTRLDEETKRQAGNCEYAEFTVGVLGSGQVFGELAVLDTTQPSPVAAISSTAVELYCFESDVLLAMGARFTGSTMKALMESLTLHDPPADKLAYYYRQKYSWEMRKNKLISRLKTK